MKGLIVKSKRTKSQYNTRQLLAFMRHNQKMVDEANVNKECISAADKLMSQFMGGSISNLFQTSIANSFYGEILCPTSPQLIVKLTRKANK